MNFTFHIGKTNKGYFPKEVEIRLDSVEVGTIYREGILYTSKFINVKTNENGKVTHTLITPQKSCTSLIQMKKWLKDNFSKLNKVITFPTKENSMLPFKEQITNLYLKHDLIVKVKETNEPKVFNVEFIEGNMANFHKYSKSLFPAVIVDQIIYKIDLS